MHEEIRATEDPSRAILREASARHDHVHVGVVREAPSAIHPPAISCLGASRTPDLGARGSVRHAGVREPCMGRFLSRGCRKGPIHFLSLSFFVRPGSPFLHPDLPVDDAGARRSRQGWRVSATGRHSSLTAPSTMAQLLWSGMMTSRGARVWCTKDRATSLYSVGAETRP